MREAQNTPFMGGIHPADGFDKELSREKSIIKYTPNIVEISMEQSVGAICEPIVIKGERVSKGQLIGKPATFTAANLHASIGGEVIDIKKSENHIFCVIKADTEKEEPKLPYQTEKVSMSGLKKEDILEAMENGGLIGMGGAGFPGHVKYKTDKKIETLLINAAECEPFLTCDYRLMMEESYAILNGIHILLTASGANEAIICIEDNKTEAADRLTGMIPQDLAISVTVLPTKYPQGGERQLVQAVLQKEVPMGGLPADIGVIISNIATAKAVADIVLGKEPVISRVVTVTGKVSNPGNFFVPIGTKLEELLEAAGGVTAADNRIILGGPMTGTCIAADWKPPQKLPSVSKTTSGVVVLEGSEYIESPCIRCGACKQVCPAGLTPFQIDFCYLEEDIERCEMLYASECIACGSCSYVCPARRELAHRIKEARSIVKQRKRARG